MLRYIQRLQQVRLSGTLFPQAVFLLCFHTLNRSSTAVDYLYPDLSMWDIEQGLSITGDHSK